MLTQYEKLKQRAIKLLQEKDFNTSYKVLKECLQQDFERSDTYNLIGCYYECIGQRPKAMKFYRVAYYMDQTYQPAIKNLERLGNIHSSKSRKMSVGE